MAAKKVLNVLKSVLLSFRTNWGLKLISLFFAVLLWNYVIVQVNPDRVISYSNIKVVFDDAAVARLKNAGFTISGGLPDKKINVSVQLKRNEVSQLNKDNIKAVADLSGITSDGAKNVKITVTSPRGLVKSQSITTITLPVEKLWKRRVPVQCVLTGTLPQDYWMGAPSVSPSYLDITGAVTAVNKVEKASVTVKLDGLKQKLSSALNYTLLDSDGNTVSTSGLDFDSPNCVVDLQVYPTKIVPIDASKSLNGDVARGYHSTVDISPKEIVIAGPAVVLDSIESLALGKIDISGAKSNISVSKTLDLPKDVHAVASNTIQVLITVEMTTQTVTLDNLPVSVIGLSPGLQVDAKIYASAVVTCPELLANTVKPSKVHLYVDATGLDVGTHTLSVLSEYVDPIAGGVTDIVLKPSDILVSITAIPAATTAATATATITTP